MKYGCYNNKQNKWDKSKEIPGCRYLQVGQVVREVHEHPKIELQNVNDISIYK